MSNLNKGLLFPVTDFHNIGPFRFPIHKDLTPAEVKGITDIEKRYSKNTYDSMRLAKKIAADRNISNNEAVNLLQNANVEDNGIIYDYIDELEKLNTNQEDPIAKLQAYALILLKYRGEVKDPESDQWESTQNWSEEDTGIIPTKLLTDMYNFIQWERTSWPEDEPEEPVGNERVRRVEKVAKLTPSAT